MQSYSKKDQNAILEMKFNWNFSHSKFLYYDIWTLRIDNIINYDCFEELFKSYKKTAKLEKFFLI